MKYSRVTLFTWLILLAVLSGNPQASRAGSANQAGLVVEFSDGSLYTGCIAFEGESISGYDLLARSGLSLETAFDPSQGIAICKIEAEGCPTDDCFCQMPEYWSYWNWVNGSWSYSGSGSSQNHVGDGDVDGWSWGTGGPPPSVSFSELCAPPPPPPQPTETSPPAPTDTETPEPQPSDTPEPQPTDTFVPPTFTAEPSHTADPPSPTASAGAARTATSVLHATDTPQAPYTATKELPEPTPTSGSHDAANVVAPAYTRTLAPPASRTPAAELNVTGKDRNLVGYAIFGALLVGLGLTLTSIILKGQK